MEAFRKQVTTRAVAAPAALPPLPDEPALIASSTRVSVSWLKLVVALLLLTALMVVNTGMLSQILREIGVVPPGGVFFGLSLAHVFAFFISLTEAGVGVCHSATGGEAHGEQSDDVSGWFTLSLWPLFFMVLALGLSVVEGYWWSQIASPTATFVVPLIDVETLQSNLFFILGFVLTWTLFGLGSVWFDAASTVLGGRHDYALRAAMRTLTNQHERYSSSAEKAQVSVRNASETAAEAHTLIANTQAESDSVLDVIEKLRQELDALKSKTPDWAKKLESTLSRADVYRLAHLAGLWFGLAVLGGVVMCIVALEVLSFELDPRLRWALAGGQVVVCLASAG